LPKGFVKPPCQHCGEIVNPRERHHPDYQREDDVIWLCRSCHKKLHAAERRAA
jgi:ribosomal protein L37AE/L43A